MLVQYHCSTFEEAVSIMDDIGIEPERRIQMLSQLEQADEGTGWICQLSECRICTFQSFDIMPEGTDYDNLECPNCHSMTSEPVWAELYETDENENEDVDEYTEQTGDQSWEN